MYMKSPVVSKFHLN